MQVRQPDLYQPSADGNALDLIFGHCRVCEALTFPAQAYGCAHCGTESLAPVRRPGTGRVRAAVLVQGGIMPGWRESQAVGEVELDGGAVEEVLLHGNVEQYSPGVRVVAIPVPDPDDADQFVCMFALYEQGAVR